MACSGPKGLKSVETSTGERSIKSDDGAFSPMSGFKIQSPMPTK